MRKTRLYTTLISLFIAFASPAAPRLTVIALIDGFSSENLSLLAPYWQQGGLRTLQEEAVRSDMTFPHLVFGGNETTATLMTGVGPDTHGYTMDCWFDRNDRKEHPMLDDPSVHGIGTKRKISAKALLAQTLSDRLRLQYPDAKIYAVGIQPETTVIMAGHAANACCWLDEKTQQWVASAAYSEGLPKAAFDQNRNGRVAIYAAHQWTPLMDTRTYNAPTPEELKKPFSYVVGSNLLRSPEANTLVIELALAIQKAAKMGTDAVPDLLLLHLNTLSPKALTDRIASAEQEDMYLRLNRDLGFLIEQLDKRIGRGNYRLLLAGRPVLGTSEQTLADIHLPVSRFNVDRAAALTATYLMALYGHERWVDGGYGLSIYLNRRLIEQKQLNLYTIQRQVADFLMDFEGVQLALPAQEALLYPPLAHGLCKKHMGDVVFTLQPGCRLMQNENTPIDMVIDQKPTVPLLLWPEEQNTTLPSDATQLSDWLW